MHAPSVDEFAALVARVRARLDAGDGVIVHCGAGIGRAGTLAAALLMSLGADHDGSLATVRAARPSAGPQTQVQDQLLAEYAGLLG
jgi:protein-tyrosine phosphatase